MRTRMKSKSVQIALALAIMLFGANALNAQNTTGDVTLNVKLNPILNIAVSNGSTVDLEFTNANDYQNGVTSSIADHLTVNSTSGFTVTVQTDDDYLNAGGTKKLPIGDVSVTTTNGTTHPITGTGTVTGLVSNKPLTKAPFAVFTSNQGAAIGSINVSYKAILGSNDLTSGTNAFTSGMQTYTSTLTYTIANP